MDRDVLIAEHQAVCARHGAWEWHNVALPYGLFTRGPQATGDNHRALKFLQITADMLRRPLPGLRVLDLGSGEGLYALEFGRHGAEVLGLELRDSHLARAEFSRRALRLDNVRFEKGDVREATLERYGRFDLVICSGILYHLDRPACFDFLRELKRLCAGLMIVDTRIALTTQVEAEYEGRTYGGSIYREHAQGATSAQKEADLGASVDNDESFWFTRHALANFLADVGFTSVSEVLAPVPLQLRTDRATFAAVAGTPVRAFSEVAPDLAQRRWPPRHAE